MPVVPIPTPSMPGKPTATHPDLPAALAPLVEHFHEGRETALARVITTVENERAGFQALLHTLLTEGPRARRIGLTGPPGAGKSSLLSAVAHAYRERNERIGVVAVDPTSPYSGGALLGDRIRMTDLATDPGIFIRSMASRGSLGGLATTTKEVIDVMDAFGFERVLVETVGVGQTELEITAAADTVVVVLVPESGDAIQAMKAGLMEIADVFVVNKADRPGSARLVKEIVQALHLRAGRGFASVSGHHGADLGAPAGSSGIQESSTAKHADGWEIPVLPTNALTGGGIDELIAAIDGHREWLERSGELSRRRRDRARRRIRDVVDRELRRVAWTSEDVLARVDAGLDGIVSGSETPYSVARDIVDSLLR